MISKAEIEQCRTSDELKSFVEEVRKKVEADSDELQRARKCDGLYKEFVDEVMPLSLFSHLLYPPETLFLPVLGNQGYDVEVFDAQKNSIDRIEIAKPHDGQAEAEDVRLVNERGFGQIKIFDLGGQLGPLAPWIAKTAEKKSLRDYRDCTLVIVASIDPPFDEEIATLEKRAIEIVGELGKMEFLAKRAFLAVPALNKCFEIDG
jgi:hypothetical protein